MKPSTRKNGERSVFDVQTSGKKRFFHNQNVLNLRRHLRFRNPWVWGIGIAVLAIAIFFGASKLFTRAEVNDFYPTTCLGAWQGSSNAAGQPETLNNASTSFSAENSAVYASGTQIFCGGFVPPTFATSGVITNVGLTLVWQIGDAPVAPSPAQASAPTTIATSTASSSAITTSSTTSSVANPIGTTSTATLTPPPQSIQTPTSTSSTPASTPDDSTSSPVTSFLREFIPFAFADSMSSTPVAASSSPASTTTIITTTTPIVMTSGTVSSTTIISSTTLPSITPDGNFLDVSYSTDGQTWVSIGEVNINNWQQFTVTLPITDWSDLQNLQVRIEGIPTTQDPVPPIYLDGMFMEVHYELPAAIDNTATATSTDEATSSTDAAATRMTLFDPGAQQTCDIQPFSQELPIGGSANFTVNLHPSINGVSYNLLMGDLPAGISVSMENPVGTVAAASALTLQAATSTAPGSLNLAVIYQEHEADGSVLSNYCQLNIDVR